MNTNLIKKSLAALTIASLGLLATGAHADGGREGYVYGHNQAQGWYGNHGAYDHQANPGRVAFQQSKVFSQQINARQDRQMERIKAGIRTGALTPREFRELMREQQEIRAMEQHFKADGIIDAREFQRLDRALDLASRNIMKEKHDRQARNTYGQTPWFN